MFIWIILLVGAVEAILRLLKIPDPTAIYQLRRLKYCPKQYLPPNSNALVIHYLGFDRTLGSNYHCIQYLNKFGLRGTIPNKSSKKRIALLGGSFVAGTGLPEGKLLCDLLATKLPDYEFINCGIVASKIQDHLSFVTHVLGHLQADFLLYFPGIQFIHFAASRNYDKLEQGFPISMVAKRVFLAKSSIARLIMNLTAPKTDVSFTLQDNLLVSKITANFDRTKEVSFLSEEDNAVIMSNQTKAIHKIGMMLKMCNHMGVSAMIVHPESAYTESMDNNLPLMHHKLSEKLTGAPALLRLIEDKFGQLLKAEANNRGTSFFSLNPPKSSQFYYDDVHLNENGVEYCSELLAKKLLNW